jgi:hypothetical protein
MKNLMLIVLSTFFLVSCNAQTKKELDKEQTEVLKDKIEPKIDYKVNKEYDENGNLIRLDSTYSYYYSNIDKDAMISDSIFKKFNNHFNMKSPFNNSFFDDFFKQENYLEDDFFKQDFFRGNFDRNQEMMRKMMQRMDSLKNRYFLEHFPLEQKKKD